MYGLSLRQRSLRSFAKFRKVNPQKKLTFDEIAAVDHGFVRMFDLNIKT